MQLINPNLVSVSRALIAAQGGNPLMLNDDGSLNPNGIVSLFFNTVEVRTSATPPIRFPIGPSGPPAAPGTDSLVRTLKPTIILSGPAGEVTVAPYGTVIAESWLPVIIVGTAALGLLGWLVFGQRS